jgi:hypothetical protein
MGADLEAVRTRWDGFLARIRERVEEILREAEPGCMKVFEQGGFDPFTMCNIFPAIRTRLLDLGTKADETWFQQVDPSFERTGAYTREILEVEHAKLGQLREWIDYAFDDFEIRTKADASRILWARLSPNLPKVLCCTQCGSPFEIPLTFTAQNMTCRSCKGVNTFEPGEARILDSFAIRCLAHEEAWERRHGLPALPRPAPLCATETYAAELQLWERRYLRR